MNIPSTTGVQKSHWWKLRYITNIFSTVLDSKDNLGLPIRRSTKDTLSRLAAQICWTIKSLGAILPFYLCVPCKIQLNNFKYIHSGPRSVSLLIQIGIRLLMIENGNQIPQMTTYQIYIYTSPNNYEYKKIPNTHIKYLKSFFFLNQYIHLNSFSKSLINTYHGNFAMFNNQPKWNWISHAFQIMNCVKKKRGSQNLLVFFKLGEITLKCHS